MCITRRRGDYHADQTWEIFGSPREGSHLRGDQETDGIAAKIALVIRDSVEVEVPVDDVRMGDIVLVKPGEKIPLTALSSKDAARLTNLC